jgi:hypothetical protein
MLNVKEFEMSGEYRWLKKTKNQLNWENKKK